MTTMISSRENWGKTGDSGDCFAFGREGGLYDGLLASAPGLGYHSALYSLPECIISSLYLYVNSLLSCSLGRPCCAQTDK